jgi:2-polyprenyl-6-methoxyphenol hydroxylase-like FAD-dependent oxidoreductase
MTHQRADVCVVGGGPAGLLLGLLLAKRGAHVRVLEGHETFDREFRWLVRKALPIMVRSGLFPRLQRRLFFGAPLPPLDPGFSFRS